MTPAQDPDQELGKILRLTLDGKPARQSDGGKTGARAFLDRSASRYGGPKTAPVISTYTFPGAEPGAIPEPRAETDGGADVHGVDWS